MATLASAVPEIGDMIAGVEIKNWSCDPVHAPFRGGLSSIGEDWIQFTCMQNLTILDLCVPEI